MLLHHRWGEGRPLLGSVADVLWCLEGKKVEGRLVLAIYGENVAFYKVWNYFCEN